MNDKYWLVWAENGGTPTIKHQSRSSANTEAERLARKNRGVRFAVVELVASVIVSDVHWTNADDPEALDSEIPF